MNEFNNFFNELADKINSFVFIWFPDFWNNTIYPFFSDSVYQYIIALLISLLGIYVGFKSITRQSPSKELFYEKFHEQNILLKEENEVLSTYIIQSFEALYKKQSKELSAKEINAALSSLKKGETEEAEDIFQNLLDEACEQNNILVASKTIQTIISLLILKGNQNEALSYYEIMVEQYPGIKEQNCLQPHIYQILEKYAVKYPVSEGGNIDLSRISKDLFNWILTHLEINPESSYVKFTISRSIGKEPQNTIAIVPNPGCQIFRNGQVIEQYQIQSNKNYSYSKAYTYNDLLKEQRVIAQHWLLNIDGKKAKIK